MIGSCCTMPDKQSRKPGHGLWLIMAVLYLAAANDFGAQTTKVLTKFGTIRGLWSRSTRGRLAAHYLGIPYAEPPIGDLRFRSPKPWSRKWNTTFDAIKDGNMCVQLSGEKRPIGSEDCLYLNIFVPILSEKQRTKKKLPVLVYVHGGKYLMGSNNSTEQSPEYLMDQDIVLVTLNYRLSIMGFFSTENRVAPGNYGLKDIVVALRWVQENIEVFYGDPKSVTLWGHSAGAVLTHLLSLNKKTEGLFHRMIMMSGSVYTAWNQLPQYTIRNHSLKLAKWLGCLPLGADNSTEEIRIGEDLDFHQSEDTFKRDEEIVGCLRSLDQKAIINTLTNFMVWIEMPCCPFEYVIEEESEDAVVTVHPLTVIKKRQFRDIPSIIGMTKDEGLVKTIYVTYTENLIKELAEKSDAQMVLLTEYNYVVTDIHKFSSAVRNYYFPTNDTGIDLRNLTNLVGDSLVFHPITALLKHQSTVMKSSTFFYYFAYQGTYSDTFVSGKPLRYGVSHGDDLNYLLPILTKKYKNFGLNTTTSDVTITNIMTEFWSSFAATGVPKAWTITPWPDYKVAKQHLQIGNESSTDITVGKNLLAERMAFWDEITKNYTIIDEGEDEDTEDAEPSISSRSYSDLLMLLLTMTVVFVQ
ncbi:venom carboxylesterase-6 [Augochlora pura]